jgi:hypothetical protein
MCESGFKSNIIKSISRNGQFLGLKAERLNLKRKLFSNF